MKYSKKSLIVFFSIVIVLSAVTESMYIFGDEQSVFYQLSILFLMWTPALAAIIAGIVLKKEKAGEEPKVKFNHIIGIRLCKIRYILLGIVLPLVYLLVPYRIYWSMHPDKFAYSGVAIGLVLSDILPLMIIGVFVNLLSALGEEIGWRGFMLPALTERLGETKTLFLTGFIWACWHLPLLAFGDYMEGCPMWYKLPAFIICIVPVGIIAGYLTYRSGSIWPAAFLHAAHNNFDQAVFDILTAGDEKKYFVSETGVFTIICAWIIAIVLLILLKKNSKMQGTSQEVKA